MAEGVGDQAEEEDPKAQPPATMPDAKPQSADGSQEAVCSVDDSEPTAVEHVRTIAAGTACSGIAYGLCRLVLSSDHTEDAVDMVHSLATSCTALYGYANMEPNSMYTRSLPARLASGRGPVVRMFALSLGYFAADFVKIAVDVLVRGKFPNLWAGRLAHHTIQLGANWPGIFGRGKPAAQLLAWRSGLCMAYMAEVSSIFLRLSNLLRHGPAGMRGLRLRQAANWALVLSFFGSRIVNFAAAISMFVQAKPVIPPILFRLGGTVQASGYALSAVWFLKIVRIAVKTTNETMVPSIEC